MLHDVDTTDSLFIDVYDGQIHVHSNSVELKILERVV